MRRIGARWIVIIALAVLLGAGVLLFAVGRRYILIAMGSPAATRMLRADKGVRAADAAIEAELRRIRAAGEPVTAKEIAPPLVPDAQNAAVLYRKAFKAVSLDHADVNTVGFLIELPAGSERDSYVAPARTVLAKNRLALELAHAAARLPKCRFPVKWEDGAAALFPDIPKLQRLSWVTSAEAIIRAADHDTRGALQAVGVGIALGDALTDEPANLSQIHRYTLYGAALHALEVVLAAPRVPADLCKPIYDHLASIYDHLASIEIMGPFKRGLLGDRARGITSYQTVESNPSYLEGYLGIRLKRMQKVILPPVLTIHAAEWLPFMAQRIAFADRPYRSIRSKLAALDARQRDIEHGNAEESLIQWVLSPTDNTFLWARRDTAIAGIGLGEAALAFKAYQATRGGYPASLDALRSAVGWKIPKDPFSGRDFVYKRQGAGAVVYSIGPDLRDDRGVPLRLRSVQSREYLGDIVWRLP